VERPGVIQAVIIGAGPAGLAVAACLGRRQIGYTLLDRGATPAAGLRRVDPNMALFSPARLSRLPGMRWEIAKSAYPTFRQFMMALDRYRDDNRIAVVTGTQAISVHCIPEGFSVLCRDDQGRDHTLVGTHVIDATGFVSMPKLPNDFDQTATTLRWMHSLDVRPEHVSAARRLLVVGAGASAADVLKTWLQVRRKDDEAWISLRSPLHAIPQFVLGLDVHYLSWLPEHFPGRPLGPLLVPRDGMFGTTVPRAIRRGVIGRLPGVARYDTTAIRFTDGRSIEPDLLVFATGFRNSTAHLGDLVMLDRAGWPLTRKCESRTTPRLYFLGARFARTLASPYLRGISRDAQFVARRIAAGH
jgi:putative flavoprotein involved in K+ transport